MLSTLRDFLESIVAPARSPGGATDEHALQLATAVLLVEVMRSDADIPESERSAVLDALRARFGLADDELQHLLRLAEETARQSTDHFGFTSRLNEAYGPDDKLHIVELMWQVAFADGRLSDHEQHVLWRIADLLHVPRGAYVGAKQRARAAAGLEPPGPSPNLSPSPRPAGSND